MLLIVATLLSIDTIRIDPYTNDFFVNQIDSFGCV